MAEVLGCLNRSKLAERTLFNEDTRLLANAIAEFEEAGGAEVQFDEVLSAFIDSQRPKWRKRLFLHLDRLAGEGQLKLSTLDHVINKYDLI